MSSEVKPSQPGSGAALCSPVGSWLKVRTMHRSAHDQPSPEVSSRGGRRACNDGRHDSSDRDHAGRDARRGADAAHADAAREDAAREGTESASLRKTSGDAHPFGGRSHACARSHVSSEPCRAAASLLVGRTHACTRAGYPHTCAGRAHTRARPERCDASAGIASRSAVSPTPLWVSVSAAGER